MLTITALFLGISFMLAIAQLFTDPNLTVTDIIRVAVTGLSTVAFVCTYF